MASGCASRICFLFYILLVSQCTQGNSWNDVDDHDGHKGMRAHASHIHHDDGHHPLSMHDDDDDVDDPSSSHMDPSLSVFFTMSDLKQGKTIPIYFSTKDPSTSPQLLSKQESNSIPFSLSHLQELLEFFSFPKHSPQAKAMEYTLSQCEIEPITGETKFCADSLESMLDSVRGLFGIETKFQALTTKHLSKHTALLQNYTVLEAPRVVNTPKMAACHTMPYPYAVFYCHGQVGDHKLFELSLRGDNGERVEAVGVCHLDTSQWNRDHVAFRVLKTRPGMSPVCHFFPADNVIWVASPAIVKLVV